MSDRKDSLCCGDVGMGVRISIAPHLGGGGLQPPKPNLKKKIFLPVKNKKTKIKIIPVLEPPLHAQSIRKKFSRKFASIPHLWGKVRKQGGFYLLLGIS